MKVAFLALTYKSFQRHDIMSRFFSEEHRDKYNLYIHNKEDLDTDDCFRKNVIRDRVETQWGKYSLVEATIKLLEAAVNDDPLNQRFVLISDSHIPVFPIEHTCQTILNETPCTTFRCMDPSQERHRFFRIFKDEVKPFNIPVDIKCASYVSQWFVCTRNDALQYISAFKRYSDVFDRETETYADECWFAIMSKHLGLPYQYRSFTFSDWDWETPQSMLNKGCKLRPHTFEKIDRAFIDEQREKGHLFIRKVHRDTEISQDYIFV